MAESSKAMYVSARAGAGGLTMQQPYEGSFLVCLAADERAPQLHGLIRYRARGGRVAAARRNFTKERD